MRCALLALILIFSAFVLPVDAAFWDVELPYNGGFVSGDASLAIGPANVPSISYSANNGLYLATRGAEEWTSGAPVATVGFMGGWSSLAFGADGQPRIAYIDASGFTAAYLMFAYEAAGSWHFETVDTVDWMPDYVSLALSPAGQACIAYCQTTGTYPDLVYTIRLARRTGLNTWSSEAIAQVGSLTGPAAVISGQNVAYVAFCDSDTGALRLATSTAGGPWQIETVDGSEVNAATSYPTIALEADGSPVLAYVLNSASSAALTLARRSGGSWLKETAAVLENTEVYHCTVCVTSSGMPFVAYQDPETSAFRNAWKDGGRWFTESVDDGDQTGLRPSLKLDSIGNIDAAYVDGQNSFVKFAWAMAPTSVQNAKATEGATVQISGLIVSAASGEVSQRIYAQTADRTCGIGLYYPTAGPTVARGEVLDLQGAPITLDGEVVLNQPLVSSLGSIDQPKPLGMGGAGLGSAMVPNNVGLLVRTWGKLRYDGPHDFRLEDGSGVLSRCKTPSSVAVSPAWNYVAVTGACSCQLEGGQLVRVLRVRAASDITVVL